MIFTDSQHNLRIELTDMSVCKLSVINNDLKQLNGISRILNAYIREAPLEGGKPVQFTHEPKIEEGYLLIKGNLIEAIQALSEIDRLNDQLKGDIIEEIVKSVLKQAIPLIPSIRQQGVIIQLKEQLDAPIEPSNYQPSLFS